MEFYVEWQLFATHHRTQYLSAKVDFFLTIKPITFKQVTIELMIVMKQVIPLFFK